MADLTHTFTVGQEVSFNRNMSVKSESTIIAAQVPLRPMSEGGRKVNQEDLTYIIEHETGWLPNPIRKLKFNLEDGKKYLFVSERELIAI